MLFYGLAVLLGAFCFAQGYLCLKGAKVASRVCRSRIAGVVIGLPVLVWSAWHGCVMLEGELAKYHPAVWMLVPVTAALAYFFLDYLSARACGGFFVLAVNELLRQAFGASVCCRPLYSAVCLLLGVWGLFMIGVPWRLRDAFELSVKHSVWSKIISGLLVAAGLIVVALPFC